MGAIKIRAMLVVWHSSPGYSRLCITTRSQDVSLPVFLYSPLWFKLWRAANEYAAKHRIYKRPDKQKYTLSRHKADRTTWKICMTSTRHRKKQKQSSPFTDANKPRGIYWPPAQWGSSRVIFLSRAPRSLCSRARRCFVKERKEK